MTNDIISSVGYVIAHMLLDNRLTSPAVRFVATPLVAILALGVFDFLGERKVHTPDGPLMESAASIHYQWLATSRYNTVTVQSVHPRTTVGIVEDSRWSV